MGQLWFKRPLQEAIRSGQKVATLRRWSRPRVKAGGRAWSPGVGWLAIDTVEPVSLDDLSPQDALADGFATLEQLRQTLSDLYPEADRDGKRWYRVRFSVAELKS